MNEGNTWPEQEIVNAWLKKHGINLEHSVINPLIGELTRLRLSRSDWMNGIPTAEDGITCSIEDVRRAYYEQITSSHDPR